MNARRIAALAVTLIASAASVASLDEAAPFVTFTGSLPEQSVVLTETSSTISITVHAVSTEPVDRISLKVDLTASWMGFADAGAGDAGAPDFPIVESALGGATGADEPTTLDRAITMAPGTGALTLSADESCAPAGTGCAADFTFTLDRIEQVRSGPVSVSWTATASVSSDSTTPVVSVEVKP